MQTALQKEIIKLKRYEVQFRKLPYIVEQIPVTVIVTDIKGTIEYVNPKFTQLTGYTFKEAIGQNPSILKSGKTPPEEYEWLWENITSGREWNGELCNKKKNGELYWESVSISPIRSIEGVITHFVAVKEDITERKKSKELLQEQRNVLEQKNIALGEVLGQIGIEKKQITDNIIVNSENLILPIIEKLKLKGQLREYVQLLQKNLQELTDGTTLIEGLDCVQIKVKKDHKGKCKGKQKKDYWKGKGDDSSNDDHKKKKKKKK